MPDAGNAHPTLGPWKGLNELAIQPGEVVGCLNVDFEDGWVRRRLGRRILATTVPGRRVAGIFEHVETRGGRQLLVGLAPVSPLDDSPRLGTIDAGGSPFEEIALPAFDELTDPGTFFTAASYKGHTIIADPTGRLLDFDGATAQRLAGYIGNDARNGVPGSQGYLLAPPRASQVLVWRNRIAAVRGKLVGLSADSGDLVIPLEAIAGGANVWPATTNFDVLTQEGDEVVAASVLADKLVCITRRGVVIVDEDAVSPIARIVDKKNGCVAPRSAQNIADKIVYLSDRRVCWFDGATTTDISTIGLSSIAWTLKNLVNWDAASGAVSVHVAQRNEYRLWVPINGGTANRLCLVFNYASHQWRIYSGWYPFDQVARALQPYDVTAAASVLLPSGDEVIVTGDSQGRIWREDVGEDDQGVFAPAYVILSALGDGEKVITWGDWRVRALHDGTFIEAIALADGQHPDEDQVRVLDGELTEGSRDVKRALEATQLLGDGTGSTSKHNARETKVRLSVERTRAMRLQPILSLLPAYDGVVNGGRGGISTLEIMDRPQEGRRG